jgi:hypothetical protein
MQQVRRPSEYLSTGSFPDSQHQMNTSSRLQPDMTAYDPQGSDQTGQARVRRIDSTSGASASSHHSSNNSNHQAVAGGGSRNHSLANSDGSGALHSGAAPPYRNNQYQVSPRSSRSDLRERDRAHGSYSPVLHPSTPSLPYLPGSGPSTPSRPYSGQLHPYQYHEQAVRTSVDGYQSRPPYPHLNQPPTSPHSAGPTSSPGLSGVMSELRLPQRSATDPQQWDDKRGRYEDGGRSRSRTMYPPQGEDTYGSCAAQAADSNQGPVGLGFGHGTGTGAPSRDQSPNQSFGIAGPGPNTERFSHNPNNLRIMPPSPPRKGRRSPNKSPTTPSIGGDLSSYMNVPLPVGSDQSHQSGSHETRNLSKGQGDYQSRSTPMAQDFKNPSSANAQASTRRPYDVHTHGPFASTAPGPPVPLQKPSSQHTNDSLSSGLMLPSTSGTLTTSSMSSTYNSTSGSTTGTTTSAGQQADAKPQDEKGSNGLTVKPTIGGGAGTLPSGSVCGSCTKPVKRQFVRAMGKVYHLDCFRCKVSRASIARSTSR